MVIEQQLAPVRARDVVAVYAGDLLGAAQQQVESSQRSCWISCGKGGGE